ncbi:MAG: SAM-dependent chlorinase/fluorinase, partial [Coriobacteriia bacterium]|nr:SAM-dependent chlorinase/fluorinase [Coriobacteriia bacterium]
EPVDPESLGASPFRIGYQEGEALVAEVVDVDRFGSVRLAISQEVMSGLNADPTHLEVSLGHLQMDVPFGRTFSDVSEGELVALFDSSGWLTLAVRLGSAADRLGIEPGSVARVRIGG